MLEENETGSPATAGAATRFPAMEVNALPARKWSAGRVPGLRSLRHIIVPTSDLRKNEYNNE